MDEDYMAYKEARSFIDYMEGQVLIFKKIPGLSQDAKDFCDWWDCKKYIDDPHSLFTLYEIKEILLSEDISSYPDVLSFYAHSALLYARGIKNHDTE